VGLYENIKKVAALRGYTISKLEQELGFPRSSISKYNSSDPSVGKIRQIANFLDVSYSSIISGDDDNGLTASDYKDIAKSLDEMMEQLESGDDSPLMYNGQELSETSKALLKNALEYALTETKKENKVKYNPNKNKG
jgi:DNA-binding helix-turn-helix protein